MNPDGTMSYYSPENKDQLFKRMDAQNQKSNNKKLNKPIIIITEDNGMYSITASQE